VEDSCLEGVEPERWGVFEKKVGRLVTEKGRFGFAAENRAEADGWPRRKLKGPRSELNRRQRSGMGIER